MLISFLPISVTVSVLLSHPLSLCLPPTCVRALRNQNHTYMSSICLYVTSTPLSLILVDFCRPSRLPCSRFPSAFLETWVLSCSSGRYSSRLRSFPPFNYRPVHIDHCVCSSSMPVWSLAYSITFSNLLLSVSTRLFSWALISFSCLGLCASTEALNTQNSHGLWKPVLLVYQACGHNVLGKLK